MNRTRPSMLMLRWLALGAAAGAALTLVLNAIGIDGPWENIALVLALLAAFAIKSVITTTQQREKEIDESDARARRDAEEVTGLRGEVERHTQLEQQLRHAKQAAEAAAMVKGEFLATMSHEIRTPLNGIVPMLDLLSHAQLAPDHTEWVRTAYQAAQQMLRIVDDILDYSKLEADKLELETTSFNLRELFESVLKLMERSAQTKGLRLNLQIDPAVRLLLRGDPVRLRQVLGNLVSNAIKFTERGSVSVHVSRAGETATQHQLRFEVTDTGIGISPAAQPRLFQAFSQADASTTRLYGGTGLGLAICKRIVDLMGGRIGVESEAGRGATFWFEVPLLKVHGDMSAQDTAPVTGRLLLLSGDPRLRLRLSMVLTNWGFRVSSVETTQEALDRLRTAAAQGPTWAYSVVLADFAGMRSTAVALYRNLERHAVYGQLRLVGMYGDEPVPDELQRSITLLSRQAPDESLRAILIPPAAAAAPTGGVPAAAAFLDSMPLAPTTTAIADDGVSTPEISLHTARVLLVEDNPVNLMVGQRLLSVLGVQCQTAGNGEAALLRMSASRFDIVLMDCQMPVMDGYTATRQWRENEKAANDGRHLTIIAMTANAMAGDRQKCLDAGMDDYLAKPVTRSELERCLHRWWNQNAIDSAANHTSVDAMESANSAEQADRQTSAAVASDSAFDSQEPTQETAATFDGDVPIQPLAVYTPTGTQARPAVTAPETPIGTPIETEPADVAPFALTPTPPIERAEEATPSALPESSSAQFPRGAPESITGAAPQRIPQPPILDPAIINELRALLGDEVNQLIEVFLEDTPRLIQALENAAASLDLAGLRDAAHSLKSSSANLGAMLLSTAAKRVELGARTGDLDRPAVAVAVIVNEFNRARQALLAIRSQTSRDSTNLNN